MENAAKLMYRIARIFALVLLAIAVALVAMNIILLVVHVLKADGVSSYISGIVGNTVWAFILVALIYITTKGIVDLQLKTNDMTPHIIMIVIGLFSGDIFYLLGGIFALVAIEQRNSK